MRHYLVHIGRGMQVVAGNLGNFAFVLIRNKVLAIFLGPMGVGWIALVNNLVEVSAVLSGAGVSDALGRELARKRQTRSHKDLISTGLGMFIVSLLVVLPITEWLFLRLAAPSGLMMVAAIGFGIAASAGGIWRFVSGIYLGLGRSRVVFHVLIWGACFNMAVSIALLSLGLRSYLAFVLLSYVPIALFGCAGLLRQAHAYFSIRSVWRMPAWRPMLMIVLPVLLGQPLEAGIVLLLRSATATRLGDVALGQIQPGLQLVILASSLFNAFAGITTSRWDQSVEPAFSRKALALLGAAVALPVIGGIFVSLAGPLWGLMIRLLFTRAFLPGVTAVPWFLAGEALHIGALLLFSTFMSRGMGSITLLPRLAGLVTMFAALRSGMDASLLQVGQAYTLTFLSYFLVTVVVWCAVQANLWRRARRGPPAVIRL